MIKDAFITKNTDKLDFSIFILNFLTKFTWGVYGVIVNDFELKSSMSIGFSCWFIALLGFLILKGDSVHWASILIIYFGCFWF